MTRGLGGIEMDQLTDVEQLEAFVVVSYLDES